MQDNIIYKNSKIDTLLENNDFMYKGTNITDILEDLQNYIFSTKKLAQYAKHIDADINSKKNTKVNTPQKTQHNLFVPIHKDTLFWCFYVLYLGFDKYDMIGSHHFVEEKQLKFNMIELIRSNKEVMKMHKIKPLSELEDDLANKQNISLKTFIALCILTNINVFVVDKHKYYESINSDNPTIHIIYKSMGEPTKYSIDLLSTIEKINVFRNTYYKMPSLENKLKSVTSYKYEELFHMCTKLGIEIVNNENIKKKTKSELYELIIINL